MKVLNALFTFNLLFKFRVVFQGSKIFRAKANDHLLGGDFENDDGTGGHSAYDEKYFLAEQCPLKVGAPSLS